MSPASDSDSLNSYLPRQPQSSQPASALASPIQPFARPHNLSWIDRTLIDISEPSINAFSGAAAGGISALLVCPLDVAKTKLQAQGGFLAMQRDLNNYKPSPETYLVKPKYRGMWGTLSTIFAEEGIPGLYRGVVPITVGYLPTWAIYFVVYENIKKKTSYSMHNYPFLAHMASALTAGACSTLATNPIWVIKTRLMTQSAGEHSYTGTIDACLKMYRTEGIRSFYSGLGPALLGLLHVAVQFPLYELLKGYLNIDETGSKVSQAPQILTASVLAKVCASTISYPHEVIRTRTQIQAPLSSSDMKSTSFSSLSNSKRKYYGIIRTAKTILLEEGWRAFYSGLGTNMVRTVPASAVTLLSYEVASGYLRRKQNELRAISTAE